MIFYFSGTGNSQMAAKQIAETVNDEIISIHQCLREKKRKTYYSEQPFVFVAPTYAWRMPKVVENWIDKTCFEGSHDAYFVLTCGGSCGNAIAYTKKLCLRKRFHFCGLAQVVMPENYIAMFPTPSKAECKEIIDKAKPYIISLAVQIRDRKKFPGHTITLKDKVQSGLVNAIYYPLLVHDKGFTVSKECISCGKCAKRCPLGNIEMVNKKPLWKGKCTHCMACIGGCPVEAIEYRNKSKGNRRYYIMED